jgi:hypothetical protein
MFPYDMYISYTFSDYILLQSNLYGGQKKKIYIYTYTYVDERLTHIWSVYKFQIFIYTNAQGISKTKCTPNIGYNSKVNKKNP